MNLLQFTGIIIPLSVIDNELEIFTLHESRSAFKNLFNNAIDNFAEYYWLYPDGPFSPEASLYISSICEDLDDISTPHTIFPQYACWIKENDNEMLGFKDKPSDEIVEKVYGTFYDENFIVNHVDILLCNVDGSYWECYAKNPKIISKCIESVSKVVTDAHIIKLNFRERKKFYKNPNCYTQGN